MDYAAARRTMVENQIRTNRVTDPLVIAALSELPREQFVPETLRGVAYIDEDLPLGNGRVMLEPLVSALLLQTAQILPTDLVLEIGCGVGYLSAAIAQMASAVVALESDPSLAKRASEILSQLGCNTVTVVEGPLREGYPSQAPYDVILFGGAVSAIPPAITAQLAEGGRMVAVIQQTRGIGRGTLFLKTGGVVSGRPVFDAAVPFLPGFQPQPTFQF